MVSKITKYDLGCGQNKQEGFIGVDKYKTKGVDIVCDLLKFPWKIKSNSADEIFCSHFFEHIPGHLRGQWCDELFRIMKVGAKANIIVPSAQSPRAYQDYTHEWPPIVPESFLYFNKQWRDANKLNHGLYDLKCDFDFVYGFGIYPDWVSKSDETKTFGVRHYWGVQSDLSITLVKRGIE